MDAREHSSASNDRHSKSLSFANNLSCGIKRWCSKCNIVFTNGLVFYTCYRAVVARETNSVVAL